MSSAADLEAEMMQAREERMKRRSRLGGAASQQSSIVSPTQSTMTTREESMTESREDTMRRLMGSRGSEVTSTTSEVPRRGAALLERYGGAMGPTGVAKAGTGQAPASLASFMGGKASGPRLGKLQGDGRSAPPEAGQLDASRYALPGMVKRDNNDGARGTSLASFMAGPTRSSPSTSTDKLVTPITETNDDKRSAATDKRSASPSAKDTVPDASPISSAVQTADRLPSPTPPVAGRVSPVAKPLVGRSAAFLSTQQAEEKAPTDSIRNLRTKSLVQERLREAQERSATAPSEAESSSASRVALSTADQANESRTKSVDIPRSNNREEPFQRPPSPFKRRDDDRLSRSPPKQAQKNALPGMADRHSAGEAPRNLYAVNRKTPEEEAAQYAAPVRLPGMGGASSPFKQKSESFDSKDDKSETLQPLTKGRARPQKAGRAVSGARTEQALPSKTEAADERISREAFASARGVFGSGASERRQSPEPVSSTQAEAEQTSESSNARPRQDSAAKLAESTAALEALLEGRAIQTPEREVSVYLAEEHKPARRQTGKMRIPRAASEATAIDTAALRDVTNADDTETVDSVQVQAVSSDGRLKQLRGDDIAVLYETDTRIVTFRCGVRVQVHAHVGRLSSVVTGTGQAESKTIMDYAKQLQCVPVDARQGCESIALVRALGGVLTTREGSRASFDSRATSMYRMRRQGSVVFVDQVDLLTTNLYSAASAIVCLDGGRNTMLWHGKGASDDVRKAARRYISQQGSRVTAEHEEGREDASFWRHFDREAGYASAWHHHRLPQLREEDHMPQLWTVTKTLRGLALQHEARFSSINIRRDAVSILQLPLELYVLVGPKARSQRGQTTAALAAAKERARILKTERGLHSMAPPIHVVVFPSRVPLELRAGLRFFSADHLNSPYSHSRLRMNVLEQSEALTQLQRDEYDLAELDDETCLPLGVGPDDLKSNANV